jgi:hypothetical protein
MCLDCNVSCKIPRAHVEIEEAGCFQRDGERKIKLNDTVPHFNYTKNGSTHDTIKYKCFIDHLMIYSPDGS